MLLQTLLMTPNKKVWAGKFSSQVFRPPQKCSNVKFPLHTHLLGSNPTKTRILSKFSSRPCSTRWNIVEANFHEVFIALKCFYQPRNWLGTRQLCHDQIIYTQTTRPKSAQNPHICTSTRKTSPNPRSKMTKSQIRKYYFFENVKETLQIPLSFIERVVRV